MTELPFTITGTYLWKHTLSEGSNKQHQDSIDRLRVAFESFRRRVSILAENIRRDLPNLTVHDINHLDALWEIADKVVGEHFELTPTEGFVFGGAILLHDLSLSIAAIDGGFKTIARDLRWSDLVTVEYKKKFGRIPSQFEIENPDDTIRGKVLFVFLRESHARNAEKLAFQQWSNGATANEFLIEDAELRNVYGSIIGRIAHSHWWSIQDVESKLSDETGAPYWCPSEWTVDPLKIACILRVADSCHLDGNRAPGFLRAITDVNSESAPHWTFQQKVQKPFIKDDAIVFTSSVFSLHEASSWWLCLEALSLADKELRVTDHLLNETNRVRFVAKRVAGVDNPELLAQKYIKTDGWIPVNTSLKVSNLPNIVKRFGGRELYGDDPTVPLRELIQNANDAIRARRIFEKRHEGYGKIIVRVTQADPDHILLEVEDNGIGMSRFVLTDFLLDFGRSFWESSEMQNDFPGLQTADVPFTGKFGIGFFSVFMIADDVQVITRRSNRATGDTLVLEFTSGLVGRSILRPASKNEELLDGGTLIKLKVKYPSRLFEISKRDLNRKITSHVLPICRYLCVAVDVDVVVEDLNEAEEVTYANEWKKSTNLEFLMGIASGYVSGLGIEQSDIERLAFGVRFLYDDSDNIIGRGVVAAAAGLSVLNLCIVSVGGLDAGHLHGIVGVVQGDVIKASRAQAFPNISPDSWRRWADEQVQIVPSICRSLLEQVTCANILSQLGAQVEDIPVCIYGGQWISLNQISQTALPNKLFIASESNFRILDKGRERNYLYQTDFAEDVIVIPEENRSRTLKTISSELIQTPRNTNEIVFGAQFNGIVEAISNSWHVSVQFVLEKNEIKIAGTAKIGVYEDKDLYADVVVLVNPGGEIKA